jgi:IclR family acetate operon transcriptional repressor
LEALASAGGELGLSQLAEQLDLTVPTLHRLLRTLVDGGYARQLASRRYALGPRLIALGEGATRLTGRWGQPILAELAQALGETANMAILDRDMITYVAQVQSPHTAMRVFTEVGRSVHLHSTGVGKAVLAGLPEQDIRAILRRVGLPGQTPRTITEVDALLRELARVQAAGYAVDDGEQELGVRCFAVPVPTAPVPTAISVSGPEARMTTEVRDRALPLLMAAAARLGRDLAAGSRAR